MAGQLIALTARSGAGKDYLASHLINVHGFVRVSFSDELKIIAKTLYPWMELDYAPEDKNKIINHQMNVCNMSAREIWITLDSLRQVDPLIFVNGVKEKLNKLLSTGVDIIVTDVRKESEFDLMFDIGATIIKINQRITDNDVLYDGEDIIDSFKVDLSFTNIKHQGLKRWEEFCIENEIIDSNWINILPTMAAAQMKENFIFGQNIQRDHSPFMWRAAIASEYGEFLEEISNIWKWWKPTTPADKQKRTEELVDVIKFSLGHFFVHHNVDFSNTDEKEKCISLIEDLCVAREDLNIAPMEDLDRLGVIVNKVLSCEISDGYGNLYMNAIMNAIELGCKIIGVSRKYFVEIFYKKYEINISRVNNGYCLTGDKTDFGDVSAIEEPPFSETGKNTSPNITDWALS